MDRFGTRVIYDSSIDKRTKVSAIIANGEWQWPNPITWVFREIMSEVRMLVPLPGLVDTNQSEFITI